MPARLNLRVASVRVASKCVAGVVLSALLAGCSGTSAAAGSSGAGVSTAVETGTTATPSVTTPATKPAPTPTAARAGSRVSAADQRAGLRSTKVPWSAGGRIVVVPGRSAAPGKARRTYTVRVEVESGLDVDRVAFAKFVMATLNDKRSWTENGKRRFARTDAATADIQVLLASPAKSASICLPLHTFGKLSCRHGANTAVLTYYRWVKAIPEYASNHTGYREYVINHEVGHVLGHGHEYCAGKGALAPLMMQQTKGLKGCRPNPWPHP